MLTPYCQVEVFRIETNAKLSVFLGDYYHGIDPWCRFRNGRQDVLLDEIIQGFLQSLSKGYMNSPWACCTGTASGSRRMWYSPSRQPIPSPKTFGYLLTKVSMVNGLHVVSVNTSEPSVSGLCNMSLSR